MYEQKAISPSGRWPRSIWTAALPSSGGPDARNDADEARNDLGDRDDGNDNEFDGCLPDCTVVLPLSTPTLQWTYVEVPGTVCMNGDTAGFGVSLNPDSKNVMIYLEGGGACFNDLCDFSAFSIPFVPPIDGIFKPVASFMKVDLPHPEGPTMAMNSPFRTFRSMASTANWFF